MKAWIWNIAPWLIAIAVGATVAATVPEEDATVVTERVALVKAYRAAKHDGDADAVKKILAPDARIWFGKKEGEGSPIKTSGGPWAEWDRYFNAKSTPVGDYTEDDATVSVVMEEINDYYRLLDRPASRFRALYYFNDDDHIAGILIERIAGDNDDEKRLGRTDEFEAWARAHHPDDVAELMPDGEIVPSLDNARRWRALLVEWRAAAGLPAIE